MTEGLELIYILTSPHKEKKKEKLNIQRDAAL